MSAPVSLATLITSRATTAPGAPVMFAAKSPPMNNHGLYVLAESTRKSLREAGLSAQARVALTGPPGPEFAAAAAAIAANAICAPLNPNMAVDGWRDMFRRLRIDALAAPVSSGPAWAAAEALRLPVLDLRPTPEIGAGSFTLEGAPHSVLKGALDQTPGLDDIAYVLPTSGTTSQPKAVRLTHRNIAHSGRNTGASLALTAEDRLMGVLPIHHAHGLISGLMATLFAGASVIMMRGFSAKAFFDEFAKFHPTWLTAVPAIHQAIIDAAPNYKTALQGHGLRLVRSASAPLPEQRYQALQELFGVPVIETYGMTEAASQVASNPLGAGRQKPGSVGVAAGPRIAILSNDGEVLPQGEVGEVALLGPNVTKGYDDPEATAAAFSAAGWFRTGDLGRFDEEGYLYLIGRLKEVINRGGEKILPQRIEAVLTSHNSVAEAAAFGAPHERLGEDVAAAVVMTPGAEFDEAALRSFAHGSGKLSDAETPRLIIKVDKLPKTITGKVQRALLAGHLGLANHGYEAALTADEEALISIWRDVLKIEAIGVNDDFFHLGGDSLMAAEIMLSIFEEFDVNLTLRALFEAPTPRALAVAVRTGGGSVTGFQIAKTPIGSKPKPVSLSQERILSLEAAMPGLPTHTIPIVCLIEGLFDPTAFATALGTLISRHETLRTIFRLIDGVWKAIPNAAGNGDAPVEDWQWAAKLGPEKFINDMLESEVWDVLDPTKTPPLRTRLLKFGEDSHALVLIFHHIAVDNWSIRLLVEELFQHYRDTIAGTALSRPRPTFQFAEFAAWQRRWSEGAEATLQRDYWVDQLSGLRPLFPVKDSSASVGFGVERADVFIPKDVTAALAKRSQAQGATLFMGLVAALKVFLFEKFQQSDIAIVTPTANRSRPATGDVTGLIANNAVLRTDAAPGGFDVTLAAVRSAVLNANAHQELPFEMVMDDLAAVDQTAAATLSEIYLSLGEHFELGVSDLGLKVLRMAHDPALETPMPIGAAKLMILLNAVDGAIVGSCIFKPHQLSGEDVHGLMGEFGEFIPGLVESAKTPRVE